VTPGDGQASIAFAAPTSDGGSVITGYTATCTLPGTSRSGSGSNSPIVVSGLTNNTVYGCSVRATNAIGTGPASTSVSVTPAAAVASTPYPVGLSDQSLVVNGITRQFRVHVPASLNSSPKALVFVLHGGGGTGLNVANTGAHPLSVFRSVADREGFVVVYPGGLPASDGQEGWVDCRGDNGVSSGADDIGFLAALIERVRGQYNLSTTRVFMAGGSNGAMMTQAFAIVRPDLIAAVASSGGSLALNPQAGSCATGPTTPKPILLAHGTADTQMPYEGGCVANLGGNCTRGRVISAEATRNRWLQANGLTGTTPTQQVVNLDANDGGPANRFDYTGAIPLRWWRLDGAGHTVASRTVLVEPNATTGIQSRDIEFAEVAWEFFNERLTNAAAAPTSSALEAARSYNFAMGGQSLIIMHRGEVLLEAYANGGAIDRAQLLASATKGFTGMIGAIAASEGLFDLDEPVSQRALTEWQGQPQKSQITYRHLLTMTSGLKELNDLGRWEDYLSASVDHSPGSTFVYSGDPNIFGLALERRLGNESAVNYFNQKLFQPLGITSIRWASNFQDGRPNLSGSAYVTARDWVKFGEFIRRTIDGTWDGPALLSKAKFNEVFTSNLAHPAYGFYWWLKRPVPDSLAAMIDANNKNQYSREIKPIIDNPRVPSDFLMAAGAFDQRLYVIPSLGLTIVRHGPQGTNSFEDVPFLDALLGSAPANSASLR
jgi:polyhydroxybutyrate depolymerase